MRTDRIRGILSAGTALGWISKHSTIRTREYFFKAMPAVACSCQRGTGVIIREATGEVSLFCHTYAHIDIYVIAIFPAHFESVASRKEAWLHR